MRDFQSVFGYLPQIVPALLGDLTTDFADFLNDGLLLIHLSPPDLHSRCFVFPSAIFVPFLSCTLRPKRCCHYTIFAALFASRNRATHRASLSTLASATRPHFMKSGRRRTGRDTASGCRCGFAPPRYRRRERRPWPCHSRTGLPCDSQAPSLSPVPRSSRGDANRDAE